MIWIDDITAVLKDTTILIFYENGNVEAFFSKQWKKSFKTNIFEHQTKERAIKIWEEVDNLLKEQNETNKKRKLPNKKRKLPYSLWF